METTSDITLRISRQCPNAPNWRCEVGSSCPECGGTGFIESTVPLERDQLRTFAKLELNRAFPDGSTYTVRGIELSWPGPNGEAIGLYLTVDGARTIVDLLLDALIR